MQHSRLGRLAILSLLFVPFGALLAQQQEQELTPEQVQLILERNVPEAPQFVPGEIIVRMRTAEALTPETLSGLGLATDVERTSGGEFIYRIPVSITAAMEAVEAQDSTEQVARRLAARDDVEYVQLNYLLYIVADPLRSPGRDEEAPVPVDRTPSDPGYASQWHYFNNGTGPGESPGGINLPLAWDQSTGSSGIVVSVIDTGLLPGHQEIAGSGNIVAGFDMISDPFKANDGDGRDSDPTDPGDAVAANECPGPPHRARPDSWHGTHVAGTIGVGQSNDASGMAGINWSVSVQPVRVLGKCGGSIADISDAVRWAAGLPVPGAPNNVTPAAVINMSLGGPPGLPCSMTPALQSAINDAVAAGALVIVAAGNDAVDAAQVTPAGCNNVVTVAASDYRGRLVSRYSNFGPTVEIMAPGGDVQRDDNTDAQPDGVYSTTGRGYEFYNGTSMAAPHVSGVLALWLADDPTLTRADLETRLQTTAMPRNSTQCPQPCGAGLIDANQFDRITVLLALDPDISIPNGATTVAVATVTRGGVPEQGVIVDFQIADPSRARVTAFPPQATTDINGEARLTVEGLDDKGETTLTATANGVSDTVVVKVPDLSLLGLALLMALMLGVELRRRRRAHSADR